MGPESRLLFLYGNDEYAIAQRVRAAAAVFTDPSEAEMNITRLDARSMSADEWNNAINSLPFMAKQRLVILANPSSRFSARRAKKAPSSETDEAGQEAAPEGRDARPPRDDRKEFLRSLEDSPATTRVVITETVDFRTKRDRIAAEKHWLATWMHKNHHAVEMHVQPTGTAMQKWIMDEARREGGEFAQTAAAALSELVGSDTRQAAQEVTKLLTYVNWSRPVSDADVSTLSPLTAAPDVFAMADAMAEGKASEAQRMLHRMLREQNAFGFWGMVIRQFRYMLVAREVLDSGGGVPQAVRALSEADGRNVHEFVAKKALKQARGFSMPRLEQIYRRLLEMDVDAKTGRMPLEVALDLLVVELGKQVPAETTGRP